MRRRMMMNKALPYDAEVEYLESTGTQWINLDRAINSESDDVYIKFTIPSRASNTQGLFGSRVRSNTLNFSVGTSKGIFIFVDVNNSSYEDFRVANNIENTLYDFEVNMSIIERVVKYNGNIIASSYTQSDIFTTNTAYLFNVNGLNAPSSMVIKKLLWRRNGHPYMDLIPVRKGQVGYLYDKVSGELFGNAGTGSFTIGPDKVNP